MLTGQYTAPHKHPPDHIHILYTSTRGQLRAFEDRGRFIDFGGHFRARSIQILVFLIFIRIGVPAGVIVFIALLFQ